jgi:pyruvate ferredoxin oxidoreductase alpha subunit
MKPHILSSAEAAACGAKLSCVDMVCSHPMPFSAEIADAAKMLNVLHADSFSSALNTALGSELGGKRAFVISSIPQSLEDMFTASYMRLPVVLANVSRPIGTFSIKHDHSDVLAMRDSGWLIFMPESNQELLESIIQAYKVCEDPDVLLPGIVNIDISNYYEPVQLPNEKFVRRFVSRPKLPFELNEKKHQYFGVPDLDYQEFKQQQQKAMKNAAAVIEKASASWKKNMKRDLPLVEPYKLEDADYVMVVAGFHSTTAKAAVNRLRAGGKKAGLLRLRVVRPWPQEAVANALKNAKRIAVFDQSISLGKQGILHGELGMPASNFISLGKYPSEKDFLSVFERIMKTDKEETVWL